MASRRPRKVGIADLVEAHGINPSLASFDLLEYQRQVRNATFDLATRTLLAELGSRRILRPQAHPIMVGGTVPKLTIFGVRPDRRSSNDIDLNYLRLARPAFWNAFANGIVTPNFTFRLSKTELRGAPRSVVVESHLFPSDHPADVGGGASIKVDLVGYPRVMAPEMRRLLPGPLDYTYNQPSGLWLPALPPAENAAGKLCRWYREPGVKDLHDNIYFMPYMENSVRKVAEIATWISTQSDRDRLVSLDADGVPVFHSLEGRLGYGFTSANEESIYTKIASLVFVPDISTSEKRSLIDGWLGVMLEFTDTFERTLCQDERLLAIATRSPDYEALAYELDDELHKRYGTEGNPYRRRPPEPDRSHDPTILVPGSRHGGARSDALAFSPDRPMSATDNGSTATQERCGAPTKARNGENDGPPCRRPLGESRRCPTHGYRPPT